MTSMLSIDLSTFDQEKQIGQELLEIDPASLYKELEKVKDRRGKKGKRYSLALILTLILLGKLAGETTIDAIIDWINFRKNDLKKLLNWPKRFPSNKTYSRALACCDDKEVVELLAGVIAKARGREKCGNEPSRLVVQRENEREMNHLAADGKTLRGTLDHANDAMPSVHILTLYNCSTGITIQQYVYKDDESEIAAAKEVLQTGLIKGSIITTDALYTFKQWCAWTHARGAYYSVVIKKNTPVLYQNLEDFFGDPDILKYECDYFKKVQKGHGRLEMREIWISTQLSTFLEKEWTGVAQVYRIRKTVIEKGKKTVTFRYGMTDVPREKANAERILEWRQNHWHIENCSHYRRDVTLGEDACQVRINKAPEVLSALNGAMLALMDFLGIKNMAKQTRIYNARPKEALQLLFGKLSRQNG
jgi:predicted transposase YbfD/YdcC